MELHKPRIRLFWLQSGYNLACLGCRLYVLDNSRLLRNIQLLDSRLHPATRRGDVN